jgi:dipeptidyl aminopeptidase/acylaminoacyl peptidase
VSVSRIRRALLLSALTAAVAAVSTGAVSSASLSVSPTETVIAYKCANSLCLTESGTRVIKRRLLASNHPWPQWDPAFSPDGREIAFRGYWGPGDGAYALYLAPISGCMARRLTRGIAGDPAWSPDGHWIAFDTSGYGDIYKVHPDSSGLTELFRGHGVDEGWYPAWSRTAAGSPTFATSGTEARSG